MKRRKSGWLSVTVLFLSLALLILLLLLLPALKEMQEMKPEEPVRFDRMRETAYI